MEYDVRSCNTERAYETYGEAVCTVERGSEYPRKSTDGGTEPWTIIRNREREALKLNKKGDVFWEN
jgi:hypothetical protein